MLKKEFKRKDVDRARNLLMGKSGASSETQVGYKKKRIEYKEGDVWKEMVKHGLLRMVLNKLYLNQMQLKKRYLCLYVVLNVVK